MYIIRIYKEKYCRENYDDNIYRMPEAEVDKNDIRVEKTAKSKKALITLWEKMLETHEGDTYVIKDLESDAIITGGAFDPGDIEFIEEYFDE